MKAKTMTSLTVLDSTLSRPYDKLSKPAAKEYKGIQPLIYSDRNSVLPLRFF